MQIIWYRRYPHVSNNITMMKLTAMTASPEESRHLAQVRHQHRDENGHRDEEPTQESRAQGVEKLNGNSYYQCCSLVGVRTIRTSNGCQEHVLNNRNWYYRGNKDRCQGDPKPAASAPYCPCTDHEDDWKLS